MRLNDFRAKPTRKVVVTITARSSRSLRKRKIWTSMVETHFSDLGLTARGLPLIGARTAKRFEPLDGPASVHVRNCGESNTEAL